MSFELINPTKVLLNELANPDMEESDIALIYFTALIQSSTSTDFEKINAAIIKRWSKTALLRIKKTAWGWIENGRKEGED